MHRGSVRETPVSRTAIVRLLYCFQPGIARITDIINQLLLLLMLAIIINNCYYY